MNALLKILCAAALLPAAVAAQAADQPANAPAAAPASESAATPPVPTSEPQPPAQPASSQPDAAPVTTTPQAEALPATAAIPAAAETSPAVPARKRKPKSDFRTVLNAGLTYGGDTIATAIYTNGNRVDLKAGSIMQVGIGALWQSPQLPLALRLTANLHIDYNSASNGRMAFTRFPIEAMAYYTGKENFRFGGGMRLVLFPEANVTINGITDSYTFDPAFGGVGEIGYRLTRQGWLNFRYVYEEYWLKTQNGVDVSGWGLPSVNGSHVGVNFSYEF